VPSLSQCPHLLPGQNKEERGRREANIQEEEKGARRGIGFFLPARLPV